MAPLKLTALLCLMLAINPVTLPECQAADGEDQAFTMSFSTATANTGDVVGVSLSGGPPDKFALVFMVMVNGVPFVQPIMRVKLDSNGDWNGTGVVPFTPATVTLTFLAGAFNSASDVVLSDLPSITISP